MTVRGAGLTVDEGRINIDHTLAAELHYTFASDSECDLWVRALRHAMTKPASAPAPAPAASPAAASPSSAGDKASPAAVSSMTFGSSQSRGQMPPPAPFAPSTLTMCAAEQAHVTWESIAHPLSILQQ